MDLGLKERVALVAASSQGLGKAIALGLAREGAKVAMCARTEATLRAAAAEIAAATGAEVLALPVDVTSEDQVREYVEAVQRRFGRIDICVANSGGPPSKTFEATTVDEWRCAVELNLMSTVFLARETLPVMKRRRWGRFIGITSVSVKQPVEALVFSNSVRSAVSGLLKTLANEYGAYNVLVNNVCPGYTATARLRDLSNTVAAAEGIGAQQVEQRWAAMTALRRLGEPEELANLVVFLASERAGYITGTSIAVDGGLVKGIY